MERDNAVRTAVMDMVPNVIDPNGVFTKIDTATFVTMVEDPEGNEKFVEVKFTVKGDKFDIEDAIEAFNDKVAKAVEREAARAAKAKEKAEKEAAKNAKNAKA